jgi:hypothetical protein
MARFTSPLSVSTGSTADGTWNLVGGTLNPETGVINAGDQPQFDGSPLFSGDYTVIGGYCNFAIDVDMDNITDFGNGQYYMSLPFQSDNNMLFSDGCIHDISTGNEYAILGHVVAGSDQMRLLSIASNGRHIPFTDGTPFSLDAADNFHIAGSYKLFN